MTYRFSEDAFINTFNWKSTEKHGADSCRISHHQDLRFKLFPYVANGTTPIITDMSEVIGDFIKDALNIKKSDTDFDTLIEKVYEEVDVREEDKEELADIIQALFYHENELVADNIGLYAYKGSSDNSSVVKMAKYLNDVFGIDQEVKNAIREAMKKYPYNALEKMITECLGTTTASSETGHTPYFQIFEDASKKFKSDFCFMLKNDMSSPEDLANLLSLYYFYYTAQTCIALDNFGNGSRTNQEKLYFALDWEKVSANRNCCKGGWKKLSDNVAHIFSHAVTLELLNQIEDTSVVYDYIKLSENVTSGRLDDSSVATEIQKIERMYTEAVGDYKGFSNIPVIDTDNSSGKKSESAVRHLFKCVDAQFNNTNRKAASEKYVKKLLEFYRSRWLKNRRKAGLVLNLTEQDVIFLTKISIQNRDRIRLNDLFHEFENRGIFLDNISKGFLQDFFTRLNLLDKKSDSGDAQYVKRIL